MLFAVPYWKVLRQNASLVKLIQTLMNGVQQHPAVLLILAE